MVCLGYLRKQQRFIERLPKARRAVLEITLDETDHRVNMDGDCGVFSMMMMHCKMTWVCMDKSVQKAIKTLHGSKKGIPCIRWEWRGAECWGFRVKSWNACGATMAPYGAKQWNECRQLDQFPAPDYLGCSNKMSWGFCGQTRRIWDELVLKFGNQ